MTGKYSQEILANLNRAEESIQAAKELHAGRHHDFAASRSYYAASYAAMAALLNEGFEFGKHSGVIAAIHRHFVKTGHLDKETWSRPELAL